MCVCRSPHHTSDIITLWMLGTRNTKKLIVGNEQGLCVCVCTAPEGLRDMSSQCALCKCILHISHRSCSSWHHHMSRRPGTSFSSSFPQQQPRKKGTFITMFLCRSQDAHNMFSHMFSHTHLHTCIPHTFLKSSPGCPFRNCKGDAPPSKWQMHCRWICQSCCKRWLCFLQFCLKYIWW